MVFVTKAARRKREQDDILGIVSENISAENEALYHRRATWFENVLFVRGVQYARYNYGLGRVVSQPDNDSRRVRVVYNVTRRVVEAFKALYLASSPKRSVVPMGDDETIIEAAEFASDLLDWRDQTQGVEELHSDLVAFLVETGNAFIHVGWDPSGGRKVSLPDGSVGNEGDPFMQVVDPQEISFHPHASRMHFSPYIRRTSVEAKDWLETFYPECYDKIANFTTYGGSNAVSFQREVVNLTTTHGRYASSSQGTVPDAEAFWIKQEYFLRPCPKYPKGLYVLAACLGEKPETLIFSGPNPYRGLPFVHFRMFTGPGIAWGETVVPDLKAPQRERNRRIGQVMEWANLVCNPKLFVPNTMDLEEIESSNAPAHVVGFPNGSDPAYFAHPPELSTAITLAMQQSDAAFNYISSPVGPQSEEQSASIRSSIQMRMWFEERNRVVTPMIRQHELAWNRVDRLFLDNWARFQKIPRRIGAKVDGIHRNADFYAAMRIDQVHSEIVPHSMMPQSRAALEGMIIEYTKVGIIDPINDQELKGRALDSLFSTSPNDRRLTRDLTGHWKKARRNLQKIRYGQHEEVFPDFMDNATVHRSVYEAWMVSEEYEHWRKVPENSQSDVALRSLVSYFAQVELQNQLATQAQAVRISAQGQGSDTGNDPNAQAKNGPQGVQAQAQQVRAGNPMGGNRTRTQGLAQGPAPKAQSGE